MSRYEKILSDPDSKPIWEVIDRIKQQRVKDAVYGLACSCQDLESGFLALEDRIHHVEKKMKEAPKEATSANPLLVVCEEMLDLLVGKHPLGNLNCTGSRISDEDFNILVDRFESKMRAAREAS